MKFHAAITLLALATIAARAQTSATPSTAQTPAKPPASATLFTSGTTLVLVPALVRTKNGELVYTLKADDFTLTDNGAPQKLSLEEDTDTQPLALVIAVETGGAGQDQIQKLADIQDFLEAMVGGVRHRVAVVTFDSTPQLQQNFTDKMEKIEHAMRNLAPGDADAAILDALNYSVDLLRQQPPEFRRAILLISETVDDGSHIPLDNALRAISDTNTTVYALGYSSPRHAFGRGAGRALNDPNPGPAGGCMSRATNDDEDDGTDDSTPPAALPSIGEQTWECLGVLVPPLRIAQAAAISAMKAMHTNTPKTVAHLTGGEYYKIESEKNITEDLTTISNHVPNRYVLSFNPTSPTPGPHYIQVSLKNYANLTVSARTSYWVDKDPTAPKPVKTPMR